MPDRNIQATDGEGQAVSESVLINGQDPTAGGSSSGGGGPDVAASQTAITLSDGDSVALARIPFDRHPSGTLEILTAAVSDAGFSAPTGLEIRVWDATGSTALYSGTVAYEQGSPLASVDVTDKDILIEIVNNSGGTLTATGELNARYA